MMYLLVVLVILYMDLASGKLSIIIFPKGFHTKQNNLEIKRQFVNYNLVISFLLHKHYTNSL